MFLNLSLKYSQPVDSEKGEKTRKPVSDISLGRVPFLSSDVKNDLSLLQFSIRLGVESGLVRLRDIESQCHLQHCSAFVNNGQDSKRPFCCRLFYFYIGKSS